MGTQFFDRQERARQNTIWLVVMFVCCLALLVVVNLVVVTTVSTILDPDQENQIYVHLFGDFVVGTRHLALGGFAAFVTALVIVTGTIYQVVILRSGGGRGVAEALGGQRVHPDTTDPTQRRLLNVVEEMAIASGTPVPPVYLLDESAINAFAAGYAPTDAVIGVTRGSLERLRREELQGVIAHEFSHILNGDMCLNIRLIGVLYGILLLTLIGRLLLRSLYFAGGSSRSRNDKGNGLVMVLFVTGLVILVLGTLGSLLGGLIKAAVSRQREYLADASAVQFTRNPAGLANALKQIGTHVSSGRLNHPNAGIASHMFFAQGVFEGFSGLMATHPPLAKRILAIDPQWDGRFPDAGGRPARDRPVAAATSWAAAGQMPSAVAAQLQHASFAAAHDAYQHAGKPLDYHRRHADRLLRTMQPVLIQHAHEAFGARSVVSALLLSRDEAVRKEQLRQLEERLGKATAKLTVQLAEQTDQLAEGLRLPLVDLTLPALKEMSAPQYQQFRQAFEQLVWADQRLSIFEWTLFQIIRRHLRPFYEPISRRPIRYYGLQRLHQPIAVLLGTLAAVGNREPEQRRHAFQLAVAQLGLAIPWSPEYRHTLKELDASVNKLVQCSQRLRGKVIEACAACVCADGIVTTWEAELLRGIADLFECPIPPLIEATVQA